MSTVLPQLGAKGIFTLKSPLVSLLPQKTALECVSIRSIGEIIRSGRNPYELFYESLGLDRSEYESAEKLGIYIVGLRADSGKMYYVPSDYIASMPIVGGVPYESYVLSVHLGSLPQDLPLNHVASAVENVVKDLLGTEPRSKLVKVSPTTYLSHPEHEQLEAIRENKVVEQPTDRGKYVALLEAYNKLLGDNQVLSNYIRDNLP